MKFTTKFNSFREFAKEVKVQFIGHKLNFNFSQLMDELFWVATQMKFRENEVPPTKKEEELPFFLVMTTKYCSSFSFYRGTLLSIWTWFELQLKKVNPWVEQKLKFSLCPMSWTLTSLAVKRRELNFNWTSLTLYSSVFFCFKIGLLIHQSCSSV